MKSAAVIAGTRAVLWGALLVSCCCLLDGQGRSGPVRLPGSITDTGFGAALAGSIQGTYPSGPAFLPRGLFLGGLGLLAPPVPPWPPGPLAVFNISNESSPVYPILGLPLAPIAPLAPEPEPSSVSVFVSAPDKNDAPPPEPNSPELARRNSQNLQALAATLHISGTSESPAPADRSDAPGREGEPLLLIAFKDRNVLTAIAYWTDHGTLHFVTPAREQKQVPLGDVDMERSRALNSERGVPFLVMP